MGIRFSKSIKLGSLLKLNISKSGVSLSAGKKGATINLGKNGTYLNLSPTLLGVKSTGLSYRQKIAGGYGTVAKKVTEKVTANKNETKEETKPINDVKNTNEVSESKLTRKDDVVVTSVEQEKVENNQPNIIDEYNATIESMINIHKYTEDVLTKQAFDARINDLESEASKSVYQLLIDGDEDTIESTVGAFLNNLDLPYDVKCNYELEDHVLYVDLDLPEIEDFSDEYPTVVRDEIVNKKKTQAQLKQEYANTVLSLGIYLTSNFFNQSSYIDQVTLSAFTSRRNNDGDLVDDYLYSVKYLRENFINTKLEELDDTYKFMLNFENRINMSSAYVFKAIKPYESATQSKAKSVLDDALDGLKELGYKAQDIQRILPKLQELNLETSSDYIKEALKLLSIK